MVVILHEVCDGGFPQLHLPLVVRVLVDDLLSEYSRDRKVAPQTFDHGADLLFSTILLAGVSADVRDFGFSGGFLLGHVCLRCGVNCTLAEKSLLV